MKATAVAPSNIAFIKYWGKKNEKLRIPLNGSISMNLSNLKTTTTVEFNKNLKKDLIIINNKKPKPEEEIRVIKHLDRVRKLTKSYFKAKIVSNNNFPKAAGLASSASAFAALTLASTKAIGLDLTEKELSILARQGSGSACRSIPNGFVEWVTGDKSSDSYAYSIFPENYWDIIDVVVIVTESEKKIKSFEGQKRALLNPFLKTRLLYIGEKIKKIKKFIAEKNFLDFGELVEKEALEFHAINLTSDPPILYWSSETVEIIHLVRFLREQGLLVYFTIDAGPHVHIFSLEKNQKILIQKLQKVKCIKKIIINKNTRGAYLIDNHLF